MHRNIEKLIESPPSSNKNTVPVNIIINKTSTLSIQNIENHEVGCLNFTKCNVVVCKHNYCLIYKQIFYIYLCNLIVAHKSI